MINTIAFILHKNMFEYFADLHEGWQMTIEVKLNRLKLLFNKQQKHQPVRKCLLLFREENWKFLPRTYYYHRYFYYYIIIIIIINIIYHLINYYLFDEVNYYIWF